MSSEAHSVTRWIDRLRNKDPRAALTLWERFFARMLAVARQRLGDSPRAAADEEDVVVVAFERFLHGVQAGRFPRLDNRDDLWTVLFTLTSRQALRQVRDLHRDKRDPHLANLPEQVPLLPDGEPTPAEAAAIQDQLACLLRMLDDAELRKIALARMEGYSNDEVAGQIGRSVVTVERRLRRIRQTWELLDEENRNNP